MMKKRAKAAKYLFSHKYASIADLQRLTVFDGIQVFPTEFLLSLDKEYAGKSDTLKQ